jgi:predicted O-linked N-acetylglucosamine transferase (SPINDLY family)
LPNGDDRRCRIDWVSAINPPQTLWDRAMAMQAEGRRAQAVEMVRVHLRLRPRDADATSLMGVLLQGAGELEDSERWLRRAIALSPGNAAAHNNLGVTLSYAGRRDEAIAAWEHAARIQPQYPLPWISLTSSYAQVNRAADGIDAGRRAIDLSPDTPAAYSNMAFALFQAGRAQDAAEVARRAVELLPHEPRLFSSYLGMLNYSSRPVDDMFAAHRAFGTACVVRKPAAATAAVPGRPLRIGILSGDLRDHSVGFFAESLVEVRPPDVEAIAFLTSMHPSSDLSGVRIRSRFDRTVDAWTLSDAALDEAIRAERIDVLIELSGHTGGNRLTALASKPAPVIVTAIGYPNTTGLPAVDWRVVDSITDPPGAEAYCTERLLRLDPCFLCYRPPDLAVEPSMPAAEPITFGSFNNSAKIGAECTALWARVLQAVPGSRLLMKSQTLADPAVQEAIRRRLCEGGIAEDRVELIAQSSTRAEHLALYGRVHVALDSVPYNGTTTTCEALWMGVPVVALRGDRHASRVSASLLTAAGHPEWVAEDAEGFVRIAASLAGDLPRLASIRTSLRDDLRDSPLLDAKAYAQRFHSAIRGCWREWCESPPRAGA